MVFRVTILACLAAAVCAQYPGLGFYPSYAPQAFLPPRQYFRNPVPEHYEPAHYQFQYEVNDPITGDAKSQQEARDGEAVQGSYSLVQPDGLLRVVEYGDDGTGFVANVRYEPTGLRQNALPIPGVNTVPFGRLIK